MRYTTVQLRKKTSDIIRYNSDLTTTNSKITLDQNLFSFLLEGSKSVQYAGKKVTINSGQFFLLSAGNCLMSEKTSAPNGQYKSILFFFDSELLTDFFTRHAMPMRHSKNESNQEPFLVFEKDAFLSNFVNSLELILSSTQSLSWELQSVKLEELLLYLSGRYPEVLTKLHDHSCLSERDHLIRQVVTANMYNMVTVEELAFLCYMTLSTFKRHFANLYGTSPRKWFQEKRMQKAAEMLKNSKLDLSEIHLELGYENLSGFIQSFKQIYGTTPKQYRLSILDA
jgi:AraC-like DNA-binding protein